MSRRRAPVPPPRVAVVGGSTASPEEVERARALGRGLAEAGVVVISGGRGGVMEAAARGAASVGGLTVGILPGPEAEAANPWIRLPLATGLGEARNSLVVRTAEAVVAVGGSWGTLSEIALARKMGRAVATLGDGPGRDLGLPAFTDPAEAVRWAVGRARAARGEIPAGE